MRTSLMILKRPISTLAKSLLNVALVLVVLCFSSTGAAQTAPTDTEVAGYDGLISAAHSGNVELVNSLIKAGENLEQTDGSGRTPIIVATFASHDNVVEALAKAGADLNAVEHRAYDVVTIAAVANDLPMLNLVLEFGASASNVTSPYDGTALIAAAHLGHHEVVNSLIQYDAPLDHINNLEWTALIEAVVLGDGGPDHVETARLLIEAGANQSIGDRAGVTPLQHAKKRGYEEMILLFDE